MTTRNPCVFIVDDDPSVLRGLARLLSTENYHVETFTSPAAFLDAFVRDRPGCLLLDVRLPDINGLDLQETLSAAGVHLPIVFITGHGDIPMSVRAMKAGAVDFLTKPFDDHALLAAVANAVGRDRIARVARRELDDLRLRRERLTPREREVFSLVVTGLLNKEVAHELGVSEKTVKVHRARVMEKMEADSLAELVHFAEQLGMGLARGR